MERETRPPEPPKAPKPEAPPSEASREGFFERWRRKDKKAQSSEVQTEPKTAEAHTPPKTARKKIGEFIFGLFNEKQSAPPTPEQSAPAAEASVPSPEDQPVFERARRARRFARVVIERVMNTARQEQTNAPEWDGAKTEPLDTTPLREAADDLHDADVNLGEAMAANTATSAEFAGGGYDTAAEVITGVSMAARIAERMTALEKHAEQSRATAIAAVGLGVIAVLVAGHEYLGKKKLERTFRAAQKQIVQQQTIQQQEAAFATLQRPEQRVAAMPRPERQAYYDQLSQFTHRQAEVTRGIAQEVTALHAQDVERQSVRTPETALRPEPLSRVETADKVERGPSKSQISGTRFIGGSAAGGIPGVLVQGQQDTGKAPLAPAALREEALRKARMARLRSNAWLYGVALAGTIVIIVLLLLFG